MRTGVRRRVVGSEATGRQMHGERRTTWPVALAGLRTCTVGAVARPTRGPTNRSTSGEKRSEGCVVGRGVHHDPSQTGVYVCVCLPVCLRGA
ncbi:unnamed protein product [Ixodes persulcatus]